MVAALQGTVLCIPKQAGKGFGASVKERFTSAAYHHPESGLEPKPSGRRATVCRTACPPGPPGRRVSCGLQRPFLTSRGISRCIKVTKTPGIPMPFGEEELDRVAGAAGRHEFLDLLRKIIRHGRAAICR